LRRTVGRLRLLFQGNFRRQGNRAIAGRRNRIAYPSQLGDGRKIMSNKQKLELTWIGKEKRPQLEPRILLADAALSHHAAERKGAADRFDNILIQGDNLLALKALESEFAGQVKCIYIDPPYNTGSAFEHYPDGLEHSVWLTLMRDRLAHLLPLLSPDGSIWINIDDGEAHYLKVLCDEILGRRNFVGNIVWEKAYTANQTAIFISNTHDHLLVYAKDVECFEMGKVARSEEQKAKFTNPDGDPRGPWKAENLSAGKFYSAGQFKITGPHGDEFEPPKGRYWRCNESQFRRWLDDGRITFGRDGRGRPMLKKFLDEMEDGLTPTTWWTHEFAGSNKSASIHLKGISDAEDVFQTPKPEQLIGRVLELATDPGDLVLDSFAGSGTTGAVSHKMGRRWIMVEQGEHAVTHIVPRLKKVIDGEDSGGVTEVTGWQGGGGFRFFRVAPSLCEKDGFGNWVVSKKYDAAMLTEAICKHEGFTYAPSTSLYWMHGYSSERDFIYVTTQSLPHDQLKALSDAVGPERSLLVCCKAFQGAHVAGLKNLTVKKIPLAIMHRCEWGKDDYSMGVAALAPLEPEPAPVADASADEPEAVEEAPRPRRSRKKKAAAEPVLPDLFDVEGEDA
jgi:adenine-specific DNA-methyltransferase